MLDHGMRGEAHLARNAQALGLRLDAALEGDAVIGAERLHAIQPFQKVEVPHGAAEFAIGGAAQSDLGLARDDVLDGGVLGSGQIRGGDLAALAARRELPSEQRGAAGCRRGRRETAGWFGS